MKRTNRWIAILAALTLLCTAAAPLAATAEGTLSGYLAAVRQLMLRTPNVTVTGEATFSMDGEVFKKASGRCVRAGTDGYTRVLLHTPRVDGTERETGYTVVTQGDEVFAVEDYHPADCYMHFTQTRESLMRETTRLDLLLDLCATALDRIEPAMAGRILVADKEEGGESIRLQLSDADIDPTAYEALNLLAQYAAQRFFRTEWDVQAGTDTPDLSAYNTVTDGVLYTTRGVSVDTADVTASLDRNGRFESASGSAAFILDNGAGAEHRLEVSFRVEARDWDESSVTPFDPADYGTTLPDWYVNFYSDVPAADGAASAPEENWYRDDLINYARRLCRMFGYGADLTGSGTVTDQSAPGMYSYCVTFNAEDGTPWLEVGFDGMRNVIGFNDLSAAWREKDGSDGGKYTDDPEQLARVRADLTAVAENMRRGLGASAAGAELLWERRVGDGVTLCFENAGDGVTFAVRVEPAWRVEMFQTAMLPDV